MFLKHTERRTGGIEHVAHSAAGFCNGAPDKVGEAVVTLKSDPFVGLLGFGVRLSGFAFLGCCAV